MNKGCIYWDESSRGYNCSNAGTKHKRGRWVGEKNVDGRRVRMRSTDFDRVMAWINQEHGTGNDGRYKRPKTPLEKVDAAKLTPIVGMPYSADVEGFYLVNKFGYKLKPTPSGRRKGNYVFKVSIDRKQHSISANRIMYAALHGISPFVIPESIVVSRTDNGDYVLKHKSNQAREASSVMHRSQRLGITDRLQTRMQEMQLLQQYYATGNMSEVIAYTIQQTDNLVSYIRYNFSLGKQNSVDVATEAVDWFCRKIENGNIAVTAIFASLKHRARDIIAAHKQQRDITTYRQLVSNIRQREQ